MTTTATEPRVLGRRRHTIPRVEIPIAVYRGDAEEVWTFTGRANLDTSSVFGFGADDTDGARRLRALRDFLLRVFIDDDGVGVDDVPTEVVESATASSDDGEGASTELVPIDEATGRFDRDGAQWRIGGQLFPSESLALAHAREHGSSLRRFVFVMDSPRLTVEQSALEEIVDVVVSAAADRPTEPSSGSSRSAARRRR